MKSMRTIGVLLIHVTVTVSACSSDNDPKAKSSTTASIGGSSNLQNTGGTTAQSTNATSSGGSASPLNTGGSSQDSGISDGSADSSVPVAAPSIVGIYTDGYFEHRIMADTWYIDTSIFHITIVNNSAEFLIALADSSNQYSFNLWNRFDWNIDSNHVLRYCETTFDAPTEQAALDTPAANAQDFVKGCSGFSWSVLTPIDIGDAGADAGH